MNGNNGNEENPTAEEVLDRYTAKEFYDAATEKEFMAITAAFADRAYELLRDWRHFNKLPLLDRITKRIDEFKHRLIESGSELSAFNLAYGAGGRTKIREAINAYYHYISSNFPVLKKLLVGIVTDIIRGKKFTEVLVDCNTFVFDVVKEIKKDSENHAIIRRTIRELTESLEVAAFEIMESNDPYDFDATIHIYDVSTGKLKTVTEIEHELNEVRCAHVRTLIEKKVRFIRNKYEKPFAEFTKTAGLGVQEIMLELEKKVQHPLPAAIPTDETLRKQMKEDNFEKLIELYNSLT